MLPRAVVVSCFSILSVLAAGAGLGSVSLVQAQFLEPDVQVLYSLQPDAPGFYGFMASGIGDINGDGVSEFIIGAPRDAAGGTFAGRAYVYSGSDGALLNVVTGSTNNRLGFSVAGVGDVNKDGVPDYAAGGPGRFGFTPGENGRVVVLSGKDHSILYDLAATPGSFFGYDINAAGDVNGDTYADLIVGAPLDSPTATFAGRVFAISGRDGSTLWFQNGQFEEGSLGTAVSGVGDLDGDGLAEQCVGAAGDPNHPSGIGQAYVLSGRDGSYQRTLKPKNTASTFGHFYVHASDDLNGDGVPDIYVADFLDSRLGPDTGRAYVFSGSSQDAGILRIFNGEISGDSFGAGRPVHDLNGDGAPDYIISANLSDAGATDGGKTYLLSGKTGKVLRTFTGTAAGLEVGFDALPLGDVNGDGRTDFLLTGINVAYVVAGTH
jgi:hypothetical protein